MMVTTTTYRPGSSRHRRGSVRPFEGLGVFNQLTQTNDDPFRVDVKEVIQLFLEGKLPPDYPVQLKIRLAGDATNKSGGRDERAEIEAKIIEWGAHDSEFTGHEVWTATVYLGRFADLAKLPYIAYIELRSPEHLGFARQTAQYNVTKRRIPAPPSAVGAPGYEFTDQKRARAGVTPATWKEFRGQVLAPPDPIKDLREYVQTLPRPVDSDAKQSGTGTKTGSGSSTDSSSGKVTTTAQAAMSSIASPYVIGGVLLVGSLAYAWHKRRKK